MSLFPGISRMLREFNPNHTIQRMRAGRSRHSQIQRYWRLARTADGGR